MKPNILDSAKEVIYGDREKTYGNPAKNLTVISNYWRDHLEAKYGLLLPLTVDDVCIMMTLLKLARLANTPTHVDSMLDACGYMALMERVQVFFTESVAQLRKEYKEPGQTTEPTVTKQYQD